MLEGLFKVLLRHNYSRLRNKDKCWLEYDQRYFILPGGFEQMQQKNYK